MFSNLIHWCHFRWCHCSTYIFLLICRDWSWRLHPLKSYMSTGILQLFLYLQFCDTMISDNHLFSPRKNFRNNWLTCCKRYLWSKIHCMLFVAYCWYLAIMLYLFLQLNTMYENEESKLQRSVIFLCVIVKTYRHFFFIILFLCLTSCCLFERINISWYIKILLSMTHKW